MSNGKYITEELPGGAIKQTHRYTGTIRYFDEKNKLHREDGPAVIYPDGYQKWYYNNKLHRFGGPAVIYPDGRKEWWLNGKKIRKRDFKSVALIKVLGAWELFTPKELLELRNAI